MKHLCGHLLCLFFSRRKSHLMINTIFISPHCIICSFVFFNMWSIRVDILGVTLVADFINCLRPKVLQNSRYFIVLYDILFAPFIMFLLFSPNIEPFWYKFIFRSPKYWPSLNRLIVFLETLLDLKIYKQFQL